MTDTLTGQTALVTGATAGIGYAIALQLAAEGAEVIVHGRNAERGAKTVQDIENAGGKARFVAADVSDATDVRRLAAEAGDVDILVNNAGIYRFAATVDTTDTDFDEQINTNLRAPYVLVQNLVPGMVERGAGTVINVSSVAASTPAADAGIYGASKAALELLTKLWADEFGAQGVRVNAVSPGPTETPGTDELGIEIIRGLGRTTALGRTAVPEEIANVVTFLASPAASYVNGAILAIGGGSPAVRPAA
ncbi:SDR family NAD(P)-dependent oxidoreductase [Mycolicibacterium holsaticum]|uniref:SDR family NAD(P)-dependent oxidoreductase n=1 Tax=Mycolicibacterium holsaticum TaxID=152142 RepID=UPI001C7E123C|nr:SDR family oxidoreductase [Mycolicibacterium holsaticum]MDA4107307.1 short-chain dehydrogenase [Mycolicibacterium holsaticum DSM 44478 = JCM 12374]QZA11840.1 SDR family oxidoreductase [Mycolicibacterium holsaticum DSM 44478 = JCM 12374]UNC10672.1 SDR family oxidoreductase [Mycolicibacterium holsaticum DSM 44478 = JCM 12374]